MEKPRLLTLTIPKAHFCQHKKKGVGFVMLNKKGEQMYLCKQCYDYFKENEK